MDIFKWQWKITPQSLFSSPDNRGLKLARVIHSRVKVTHIRVRVMHIMSTLQTKSVWVPRHKKYLWIPTISKPAQLCLFLIYLVNCHQKQCSLFPHFSDSIKKEAQQATTWNKEEGRSYSVSSQVGAGASSGAGFRIIELSRLGDL